MAYDHDHLNDAAVWVEAVSYMETHGDRWPVQAIKHLKVLAAGDDRDGFHRWLDVMTTMSEIAETPRQ